MLKRSHPSPECTCVRFIYFFSAFGLHPQSTLALVFGCFKHLCRAHKLTLLTKKKARGCLSMTPCVFFSVNDDPPGQRSCFEATQVFLRFLFSVFFLPSCLSLSLSYCHSLCTLWRGWVMFNCSVESFASSKLSKQFSPKKESAQNCSPRPGREPLKV